MAKKVIPLGKPNKLFCILSAVLAIALVVVCVLFSRMSAQTTIFKEVEFGKSLQNSQAVYAETLDYTILGTYKNLVNCFDKSGNQIWSVEMNGSTSAMSYDSELDYVIVGSQDRNIYVIDAKTGEVVISYAANGRVYDLDYDQATQRLLCMSSVSATKSELAQYDLLTGEKKFSKNYKMLAQTAQYCAGYTLMAVGDNRGTLTVLDNDGGTVFSTKVHDKIINMDVAEETGDIVLVTENGYTYRFDSDYNQLYEIKLDPIGEGYTIAISADGHWVGVGTREGDVHILDQDGVQHYYFRAEAQIPNIYFGKEISYVVTLSTDLFEFSTERLDNIGKETSQKEMLKYALYVLSALLVVCLVVAIPHTRRAMQYFFRTLRLYHTAYLMLLPGVILLLIFNYYPTIQAFIYAFTDWSKTTPTMRDVKFIGFDNFRLMISEGYFLIGVQNMFIIMFFGFLKLLTVPVLLANLVYDMRSNKARYAFRLMLVLPMVVPGVVGTLMWGNIYDPNVGFLKNFLALFGIESPVWLGDPKWALFSIIFIGFPWIHSMAFLIFYGGLINIPTDLFEAAKMDGSNRWWDLWHIKIPLITPQLKMMLILQFIGAIQDYGAVLLLTDGGPGTSTYVPGLELYNNATVYGRYGYACALGLVMFAFILVGTIMNLRIRTQELN